MIWHTRTVDLPGGFGHVLWCVHVILAVLKTLSAHILWRTINAYFGKSHCILLKHLLLITMLQMLASTVHCIGWCKDAEFCLVWLPSSFCVQSAEYKALLRSQSLVWYMLRDRASPHQCVMQCLQLGKRPRQLPFVWALSVPLPHYTGLSPALQQLALWITLWVVQVSMKVRRMSARQAVTAVSSTWNVWMR